MSLPYARATVSAHNAAVLRTSAPCLYLKKRCGTQPEYFEEYSISGPITGAMQMETHQIMIYGPISNHRVVTQVI